MIFLFAFICNAAFQTLWITSEKAWMGFRISIINGAANVFLDWLFMEALGKGIAGAALASALVALSDMTITLIYFIRPNRSSLRFIRFGLITFKRLSAVCFNGLSEMADSVASNIMSVLFGRSHLLSFF